MSSPAHWPAQLPNSPPRSAASRASWPGPSPSAGRTARNGAGCELAEVRPVAALGVVLDPQPHRGVHLVAADLVRGVPSGPRTSRRSASAGRLSPGRSARWRTPAGPRRCWCRGSRARGRCRSRHPGDLAVDPGLLQGLADRRLRSATRRGRPRRRASPSCRCRCGGSAGSRPASLITDHVHRRDDAVRGRGVGVVGSSRSCAALVHSPGTGSRRLPHPLEAFQVGADDLAARDLAQVPDGRTGAPSCRRRGC